MPKMNEAEQLALLKKIIAPTTGNNLPVNLSQLKKIIKERIPNALEKNAPPNFPELYFDFEYVYSKFYDFLLFNPLIGKTVVALGGGFSSGKSTFLNTLLGNAKILPTAIRPSTSVPAYVIKSDNENAEGINTFGAKVAMNFSDIRAIAHGFGENEEEDEGEITLGHLLRSLFVATPNMPYENIAFLDTPGYSKADSEDYSAKTDEKIAHSQLNASDYILWFVAADAGTISVDDVNFLAKLDKNIPKLIIVNKADKAPNVDALNEVKEKIKAALDLKGIRYENVLTHSRRDDTKCDREQVQEYLQRLNTRKTEVDFARRFKKLFVECKGYYDDALNEEQRNLSYVNRALTFATDNEELTQYLSVLLSDTKTVINDLSNLRTELNELKTAFFSEIKAVADSVNIYMPEPSEIDLIDQTSTDLLSVAERLVKEKGLTSHRDFLHELKNNMPDSPSEDVEKEQMIDFDCLRNDAKQDPLYNHPLAENNSKEPYLTLMVSLLAVDGANASSWKHIYRIAAGGKYEGDVHELLPNALRMNETTLMNTIETVKTANLKDMFILDSLLIVRLMNDNSIVQKYLSVIYSLLEVSSDVLYECLSVSDFINADNEYDFMKMIPQLQFLSPWNVLCYIKQTVCSVYGDIQSASESSSDRVSIFVAKIDNHKLLDISKWQAKEINFICCTFRDILGIHCHSEEKNVRFLYCSFYKEPKKFSLYDIDDVIRASSNTAFIHMTNCEMIGCDIDNIKHGISLLFINKHGLINRCKFNNCEAGGYKRANPKLFILSNTCIMDSSFVECRIHTNTYGKKCDTFCSLFAIHSTIIENCKFISCSASATADRNNRSCDGYSYLICGLQSSKIRKNIFKECAGSFSGCQEVLSLIMYTDDTSLSENIFEHCTLYDTISWRPDSEIEVTEENAKKILPNHLLSCVTYTDMNFFEHY